MSRRDESIVANETGVRLDLIELINVTERLHKDRQRQRHLIQLLRKSGLSARFLARVSDMSHQTILNICKVKR